MNGVTHPFISTDILFPVMPHLTAIRRCSIIEVERCIGPLEEYEKENVSIFPTFNESQLNALCRYCTF